MIDDEETIDAFYRLSRLEGIIPAIESSHAVAYGMKLAKSMEKSLDEMESKIQILMNNPDISEDEKSADGKKQKTKTENSPVLGLFDESSEITGTRA